MRLFCTCAELGLLSCVLGKAVPTGRMRADMHAATNNSSRKVKSRLGHFQVSFILFFGGGGAGGNDWAKLQSLFGGLGASHQLKVPQSIKIDLA
jgi:hypothetical protein